MISLAGGTPELLNALAICQLALPAVFFLFISFFHGLAFVEGGMWIL